jgi:hypothetical protein
MADMFEARPLNVALVSDKNHEIMKMEDHMKCNIGKTDRIIRIVLGACIIAVGVYSQSWWAVVGAIPILTATIGWCPAYVPFGISSCKTKP